MDLKLIIKALEIAFPQISNAMKWIRKHVKKYKVQAIRNIVYITVEVDNIPNAEEVSKQLKQILEALLE